MPRSVNEWRELIAEGEKYRERFGRSRDWPRWWSYYRGDWDNDRILPVNMIFAFARSLIPRLYFRNPRVVVTPLQPGYYLQAKVLERVDNLIIREIGVKRALKAAALDAFLYGTGIIKRGYDSEYGFDPEKSSYERGVLASTSGEAGGQRIEYNSAIRPGWPWVERIHPATFVVPWGARSIDSAPWVAHMVVRHIDDVKADPKYRRSVTRELQPTLARPPLPHESPLSPHPVAAQDKAEYVRLWEIYDAKTGKIYVIADGCDKFLREDDDVLSTLGFPFYAVVFNPDEDHFWGISDLVNLEPLQHELNEIRTQLRMQRRIAIKKILYKDGAIDEVELMKLLSPDWLDTGIGVKVKGDPASAVMTFQPSIPADHVMATNEVRMDMREVSGFSRNQLGEFDRSTRRTATEAQIVEMANAIRVDERRDVLADVLTDIMRGVNESIFEWWTEEHVAYIVGPDGARYWLRFTGDELRGDYTYRIDPDSALPTTADTRRQEAIELYRALANDPIIGQGPGRIELLRHLLLQFEGIEIEAILQPAGVTPVAGGAQVLSIPELAMALAMSQMQGGGGVAAV